MKIKLINQELQDSIILEEETIEEIRASALVEMTRRGWKSDDCYLEDLSPTSKNY